MDYVSAIRQSGFTKLWTSQILSQVAQNLLNFALIINVFNATADTRFANVSVSLLVLAFGIPSIFFAAFAGAVVDRYNRQLVMFISNLSRALLVLLFIPFHNNFLMLLLLSFVISSITQFFLPAESAMIPQVVPKKLLLPANSLFIFSIYASFIAGYAVAAPVIASFSAKGPYIVTSIMFGVASLIILLLPRYKAYHRSERPEGVSFWQEAKMGIKLAHSHRWMALAIRQLTITQGIVCIILALAPALSVALLHRPLQDASTYLVIPAGLGMVVGVAMVGQVAKRWNKIRVLEIGLIIAGAALALLGLSGLLYRTYDGHSVVSGPHIALVVAVLVFALGMLNAIISSIAQTVLQENASEEIRGKVFGSLNMFINLASTFPILLTGILADLISVTTTVTIMGVLVTLFAAVQLWRVRHRDAVSTTTTR